MHRRRVFTVNVVNKGWGDPSSWNNVIPNAPDATAVFEAAQAAPGVSLGGQTFTVGTINLVNPNNIQFGGPNIGLLPLGTLNDVAAINDQNIGLASAFVAGAAFTCNINLAANATITTQNKDGLLLIGATGAKFTGGSLTKTGPGMVEFTSDIANLSLTGTLNIEGGKFRIDSFPPLHTNRLLIGGDFAQAAPVRIANVQITNGATLKADGGTTILTGGTLAVGASFVLDSPLTVNGGKIQTLADTIFPNNATVAGGGAILDSNTFNSTFSGVFSGTGALTKIGSGTVTLSGVNTYSGGTFLNEGSVAVAADNALGAATGGLTFNGGTLQFDANFDLSTTRPITLESSGGTINTQSFSTAISQGIIGPGALTNQSRHRHIDLDR